MRQYKIRSLENLRVELTTTKTKGLKDCNFSPNPPSSRKRREQRLR
jgi:hypothetical protein